MLDKIEVHIEAPRVDYEKLSSDRLGETSESIRKRAQVVRNIQLNLLARVYHRVLKLARTIADLAGSEDIQSTSRFD